ncbi:hypothetical protein [Natrinema soli]|uniref:Uncharacterized protein n=1 Tax=Natrinema soli TaxID=1930624 RepID=A0ABD5SGK1_9EURY|nr:hypothetical protein [Natrinema soli]
MAKVTSSPDDYSGLMTYDYARSHEHELEAEYLTAADTGVLDLYQQDESLFIDVAVLCPTCSETLRLSAHVTEVVDSDIELPLEEADEIYD